MTIIIILCIIIIRIPSNIFTIRTILVVVMTFKIKADYGSFFLGGSLVGRLFWDPIIQFSVVFRGALGLGSRAQFRSRHRAENKFLGINGRGLRSGHGQHVIGETRHSE